MSKIISEIRQELKLNVDVKYKKDSQIYHKHPVKSLGVRTPFVRKIAKKYFREVKDIGKKNVFSLCEELFKLGTTEEIIIAVQWASNFKKDFEESDFKIFDDWFSKYVANWGSCDDYCLSMLSHFIVKYPKYKNNIKSWAKSSSVWKRRASAVAFIQGGSSWRVHSSYLKDVFDVALALMKDKEDLVQKGYGWMLKVASDSYQKEVFDFVMKHKNNMARTALRYAIEKMPQDLKKRAMAR